MPEAQCIKYRIRPDRREQLANWIRSLEERSEELRSVFAEAGLVAEAVFLEESDGGDHLLIYTHAADLAAAMEALSRSEVPIVREFNQLLSESVETEGAVPLKLLFHSS